MRRIILVLFLLTPLIHFGQVYKSFTAAKDKMVIQTAEGALHIIPLTEKTFRIQFIKDLAPEAKEFIFINRQPVPYFKCSGNSSEVKLATHSAAVIFNKASGQLSFADNNGKLILSETAGSRSLLLNNTSDTVKSYTASQGFESPANEMLFGLGQFQDGNYNLKNISRKLVQVNSQIAIPFLYSSKGYGILWHQYGLTAFNPADAVITLQKADTAAAVKKDAEVTTTSGTQRVSQQQSLYSGSFSVDADADYGIMLDLGDMDNRHLVIIDGVDCINQSNLWLPPAVSKLVHLKAGTHTVQVVCKSTNTPRLSFRRANSETVFRSPDAQALDYVVFLGNDADEVIAVYRKLTGEVPMLPLWAFGFWQCRERYTSGEHLVKTVEEFRKRNLPVDVIVQDWQYWGKNGWGIPKFDETHYPEPEKFIKQLHDLHARFSISVWENLDKKSDVTKPYLQQDLFIPNSPWLDMYNPAAQKLHWKVLNENLFSKGVDSWWMDATEPENDALAGKQTYFGPGKQYRLTYPLFVSQSVYEGQRATNPAKRVAILTRSAFAGQQRYGTINWSGDIGWNWDAYRRQIVAGLNYSLTGMPYWTTDIGGFFRPGKQQYTDPAYHEILTRWFQWGAFNPVFRIHGYQTETEPWKYGDTVMNHMRQMLELRYRLMPYIYSNVWDVSKNGSTMMRPLVMDFKNDTAAVSQPYQYMFGKNILVAPVTDPGFTSRNVYLPAGTDWFDFWTGQPHSGAQTIARETPLDIIPLFVKAGTILPIGPKLQYATEKKWDELEIRIYPGANGQFVLYEDENDNYNYEKGLYSTIRFLWNDVKKELTIYSRKGSFPGMLPERKFNLLLMNEKNGAAAGTEKKVKQVFYTGKTVIIKLS